MRRGLLCLALIVVVNCDPKKSDCTPACSNRTCGNDGCGGSCGTCDAGETCDAGQCVACEASCDGRVCGDDGCSGSCGACSGGETCDADGACQACTADCSGRTCGFDGCSGTCGTCPDGEMCDADGLCETCMAMCDDRECGDDGCGGSCGTCAAGDVCSPARACVEPDDNVTFVRTDPDEVLTVANVVQPAAGQSFTDPTFGTTVARVAARTALGAAYYEVQLYSQLQAFNADETHMLFGIDDGSLGFVVRRVSDFALVAGFDLSDVNAPRWHPVDPDLLVHFDTNTGDTVILQTTNIETGAVTDLATLDGIQIRGNRSFDELSRDGRWVAGMAEISAGNEEIFAYDLETLAYGARLKLNDLYAGPCVKPEGDGWPDWIAPSPLGNYLAIQWVRDGDARCSGLETFDIMTGAFVGRVSDTHQHGDLGVVTDWADQPAGEREYFVQFKSGQNGQQVTHAWVPGAPATWSAGANVAPYTVLLDLAWGNSDHISCQGPAGACLVTAGPGVNTDPINAVEGWQPFENEVFIVRLDGSVARLVHHRSSDCGYWAQPRATWSASGRYVLYSSDWGANNCAETEEFVGQADAYLLDLAIPCTAACGDNECGDDGCGGSCGSCGDFETCSDGTCVACSPTCGDNECGDNGCGGVCGTCGDDELCSGDGMCVADPGVSFFVSSTGTVSGTSPNFTGGGDFGGVAGADARCQSLAVAAGHSGTWKAYLSTSTEDARDRIGAGPWYNAKGEIVAASVTALHASGIAASLAVDETGAALDWVNRHDIVTGSKQDGTHESFTANCGDYTSNSADSYVVVGHGNGGGTGQGDHANGGSDSDSWNAAHIVACDGNSMAAVAGRGHVYCFAAGQ